MAQLVQYGTFPLQNIGLPGRRSPDCRRVGQFRSNSGGGLGPSPGAPQLRIRCARSVICVSPVPTVWASSSHGDTTRGDGRHTDHRSNAVGTGDTQITDLMGGRGPVRLRDSTSSFRSSKLRNSGSKLAHLHEQSKFTYSAYLVAAGHL